MANWDEIPRDLWRLILQKSITVITDHIPFSGVCKLWRSIGLEYRKKLNIPLHVPGLMFPGTTTTTTTTDPITTNGDSLTRRFVAFPVGKKIIANPLEHDFPLLSVPHQSLCRGSHKGWLIMVNKNLSMYMKNPFTGRRIDLPPVTSLPSPGASWARMSNWYVEKAIMSVTPSSSSSVSDCFVMIFFGPGDRVAFCKVGDKKWRLLKNSETSAGDYIDGIYYKEQFYIVDEFGKIYVCDQLTSPQPQLKEFYPQNPHNDVNYVEKWYLVECGGELYEILRKTTRTFGFTSLSDHGEEDISDGEEGVHINNDSDDEMEERKSESEEFDDIDFCTDYVARTRNLIKRTIQFQIFKLETSESKWIRAKDFDGGAVFVGYNQSFAVSKSDLSRGYEGDRIYYTDDDCQGQQLGVRSGHDMGIFSLHDSKFEPLCSTNSESTKPHAVWITPFDGTHQH